MPRCLGPQICHEDSTQWVEELNFLNGISVGKIAVEGVEGLFPLLFQDMDTEVFWQLCPGYCGKALGGDCGSQL